MIVQLFDLAHELPKPKRRGDQCATECAQKGTKMLKVHGAPQNWISSADDEYLR